MKHLSNLNTRMQSILLPNTSARTKDLLLILSGVLFLALASHISIPLQPVPLTFQSAAVIFVGMIYGARLSALTLCTYLIAGASGLPVFAEVPVAPNMGYLLGFIPAAIFSGYLAQKGFARSVARCFAAAILSSSIIFLCGVPVLASYVGWDNAVTFGLLPFVFTEPMKLFAISLMIPKFWK